MAETRVTVREKSAAEAAEAVGIGFRRGDLPIQQLDPEWTYPVPECVRLVSTLPEAATTGSVATEAGPWLEWEYRTDGDVSRRSPPVEKCLERFLNTDVDAEAILAYARKWGVLGVCGDHQLASSHRGANRHCPPIGAQFWLGECPAVVLAWEPVSAWRRRIRRAQGVVSIIIRMRGGETITGRDWERFDSDIYPDTDDDGAATRQVRAPRKLSRQENPWAVPHEVAEAVTEWLHEAAPPLRIKWDTAERRYVGTLAPSGQTFLGETYGFLAPVLALQLAGTLCSGVERCGWCGEFRVLGANERAPSQSPDRRWFCSPTCRWEADKERKRLHWRKYKERYRPRRAGIEGS
jgi:hypothetical protein